jgi:hypothetical protein
MNRGANNEYANHRLVTRNYKTFTDQVKNIPQLPPSQQNRWCGRHINFYICKIRSIKLNYLQKTIPIHNFRQLLTKALLVLLITEGEQTQRCFQWQDSNDVCIIRIKIQMDRHRLLAES